MERPELLIPAGDLEKLQTAVRFGADAVYVGAGQFSLRAEHNSFTLADLEVGVRFAHEHGVKVYVALNQFPYEEDLQPMLAYFTEAAKLGIDAVIVSDSGMLSLIKQCSTSVKIHLSTQASTMNSAAVRFWHNQGVTRIVMAREVTLDQVLKIKEAVPQMEYELFIHGAMCMAYSGRCMLSQYTTGRPANKGLCAQPCRWEYTVNEVSRPDAFTVEEDERGSYIFNSKDLCLIDKIPDLIEAGITSFKVEGRMKSAYYVAMTAKIYQEAIATYCADPAHYSFRPVWREELENISHRPYTTGFYFGGDLQNSQSSAYIRGYDFSGVVEKHDAHKHEIFVGVRNQIKIGETIDIIDYHEQLIRSLKVEKIIRGNGEIITAAHNSYHVTIPVPADFGSISINSLIRKKN